eukprot:1156190-Pelagomonas_calceolata.AAC.6
MYGMEIIPGSWKRLVPWGICSQLPWGAMQVQNAPYNACVQRFGLGIGFLCYTALSIPSLIAATLLRAAPPTSLHTQDHQQHQHRMGAQGAELNGPAAPGGASLSSPPHMRDNQQYHQGAKFGCPNALDTDRRASTWERMRQLGGEQRFGARVGSSTAAYKAKNWGGAEIA